MKHKLTTLIAAGALTLGLTARTLAISSYSDIAGLQLWGMEAVNYVTQHGLMNGTSAETFSPYTYADRAMVATLIWRIAGMPLGNITGTFSDVALDQWYSDAIDWGAEQGVITGAEGRFRPFEVVTRQDLAVMLYRYAGAPEADVTVLSWYLDYNQVSSYAANAVAWAVEKRILSGDGTNLMPKSGASRVELAAIMMRYLEQDVIPSGRIVEDTDETPAELDGGEQEAIQSAMEVKNLTALMDSIPTQE